MHCIALQSRLFLCFRWNGRFLRGLILISSEVYFQMGVFLFIAFGGSRQRKREMAVAESERTEVTDLRDKLCAAKERTSFRRALVGGSCLKHLFLIFFFYLRKRFFRTFFFFMDVDGQSLPSPQAQETHDLVSIVSGQYRLCVAFGLGVLSSVCPLLRIFQLLSFSVIL